MEYTENLGLKKPLPDEPYNVEDSNENAEIIDAEIQKLKDRTKNEQKLLTIPASGWQPTGSPGLYKYTLTVPVEDITVNDVPDGKVTDATEYVAQNCNLSYTVISGNGTMTFLAESIPEADMVYAYITFKGGE